jgi:Protein of unknown function, DUF547
MNPPATQTITSTRKPRRSQFIVSGLALLAALAVYLLASGRFAPKVVYGRSWARDEPLSLDEINHDAWDALLRRHVDEAGGVGYAGWKASAADVAALDEYLALLSRGDPARDASRESRLAFWINAYNALTIRGVLGEYPTSSIQNHASRLGGYNIWRDLLLQVGDRHYSLGQIEHALLRPLREPRIHFTIVCASRGCPRLRNRAYTAAGLERQLQENTLAFFADPRNLTYDASTSRLRVSPILKWYTADFGPDQGEMLSFLAPYLPADVSRQLSGGGGVRLAYLDYDWRLNDQDHGSDEAPAPPAGPE